MLKLVVKVLCYAFFRHFNEVFELYVWEAAGIRLVICESFQRSCAHLGQKALLSKCFLHGSAGFGVLFGFHLQVAKELARFGWGFSVHCLPTDPLLS